MAKAKTSITTENRSGSAADAAAKEQRTEMPLSDLHPFEGHPFKVLDDELMEQTVESIKQIGVVSPLIVRPDPEGGFEILSGHRRLHAAQLAGLETVPVIVKEMDDDAAIIFMVDSNLQRENILPSERAFSYKMKLEAMKHQGKRGGNTLDEVGAKAGESGKTVQRYIWLARLNDELLELVDQKKIGMVQGVDLSFLNLQAQGWVFDIIQDTKIVITTAQSAKLKEYGKKQELTLAMVQLILMEKKPKPRKVQIKEDKIRQFFPESYSNEQIETVIYELLEEWKDRQ